MEAHTHVGVRIRGDRLVSFTAAPFIKPTASATPLPADDLRANAYIRHPDPKGGKKSLALFRKRAPRPHASVGFTNPNFSASNPLAYGAKAHS